MSLKRPLSLIMARVPRWKVHWYTSVESTQFEAASLAEDGCEDRTCVVAQEQTAGMGRLGRKWHSEPGNGLYLSMVLSLPVPPDRVPGVTLALGLAAKDAIETSSELEADLRWPNDVLINGRKVCGVLTQLVNQRVVAGVGINVGHDRFPEELRNIATSLWLEGAMRVSMEDLFVALLDNVDMRATAFARDGIAPLIEEFERASTYAVGKRVAVEQEGRVLRGFTEGLDPQGFLWLRELNGARTLIHAGGVRPEEE